MRVFIFLFVERSFAYASFRMTGTIARDIEKKAAGTYPMQDVFIRKAKVLRKPKFDRKCNC